MGRLIFLQKILGMTVVHEEGDDFATWISVSPLVHELALMGDELGGHWTLIEKSQEFADLVKNFISR